MMDPSQHRWVRCVKQAISLKTVWDNIIICSLRVILSWFRWVNSCFRARISALDCLSDLHKRYRLIVSNSNLIFIVFISTVNCFKRWLNCTISSTGSGRGSRKRGNGSFKKSSKLNSVIFWKIYYITMKFEIWTIIIINNNNTLHSYLVGLEARKLMQ